MLVLGSLVAAVLFTVLFREPLRRWPWVFYALAIAVTVAVYYKGTLRFPPWLFNTVIVSNARGIFAFWLFAIVMFMGVLPAKSELRRRYMPIRAELSIFAGIICVGHVLTFIFVWTFQVTNAANRASLLPSYIVAIVITVLLVVLTATSFNFVKRAMGGKAWKAVQRLAYPFFVLVYVHVVLAIAHAAAVGSLDARIGLAVYGLATVGYVVLRVRRYRLDKQRGELAA